MIQRPLKQLNDVQKLAHYYCSFGQQLKIREKGVKKWLTIRILRDVLKLSLGTISNAPPSNNILTSGQPVLKLIS